MSSPIAIKPLYNKLDDCLSADKFRLKRRITLLAQKAKGLGESKGAAPGDKSEASKRKALGGSTSHSANKGSQKNAQKSAEESLSTQFENLKQTSMGQLKSATGVKPTYQR